MDANVFHDEDIMVILAKMSEIIDKRSKAESITALQALVEVIMIAMRTLSTSEKDNFNNSFLDNFLIINNIVKH